MASSNVPHPSGHVRSGVALAVLLASGCGSAPPASDLARIYDEAAQGLGQERNPVIVIPGILGSKLEEPSEKRPVWGAFVYGAVDADTARGARLIALPMERGRALHELKDEVVATEALDTLRLDIGFIRGLELSAYVDILRTLAVGKYRDQSLGRAGAVNYGGLHYTCYQFAYDWRRDVSEQAVALHGLVLEAREANRKATGRDRRVDVVAHSMGGLVLRYYLRYGPRPLPDDGSLPPLTWEGAEHVDQAILVGTPNAGSILSLLQLIKGVNFAALITPTYRPAVLGTFPSIFQLLPRLRHRRVLDEDGAPVDVLDPAVWKRYRWGLADPRGMRVLRQLLPDAASDAERQAVADEHLAKSLARARQLFAALDRPAAPPPGTRLSLTLGDAIATPAVVTVAKNGSVRVTGTEPGDDTVSRASALMDERTGQGYRPRLRSPVAWEHVRFLASSHLGLTADPLFVNFLLYTLLEEPRDG